MFCRSIQELNPDLNCVAVYGGEDITRQVCVHAVHLRSKWAFLSSTCCSVVRAAFVLCQQMRRMGRRVDVVCATPGRLNDMLERHIFVSKFHSFNCVSDCQIAVVGLLLFKCFWPIVSDTVALLLHTSSACAFQGLDQVQFLCLDEADELLTPNFKVL